VVNGYTIPKTPPIDTIGKKAIENDVKSMNSILFELPKSEFFKVMHCKYAKEIWEKCQNIHEGDDKVKKAKIKTHRR
jgi:hypothetical protein